MATSFGESTGVKLLYTTQVVPLHRVKVGDLIEHDGKLFQVFRWLRMAKPDKPLGFVAVAVPHNAQGARRHESVALCFDDPNESVRKVNGSVVSAEVVIR